MQRKLFEVNDTILKRSGVSDIQDKEYLDKDQDQDQDQDKEGVSDIQVWSLALNETYNETLVGAAAIPMLGRALMRKRMHG